jgi:hypothetical protein
VAAPPSSLAHSAQRSGTDGQAACLTASQPGKPTGRSLPEPRSARPCEASADCAEVPHPGPRPPGRPCSSPAPVTTKMPRGRTQASG